MKKDSVGEKVLFMHRKREKRRRAFKKRIRYLALIVMSSDLLQSWAAKEFLQKVFNYYKISIKNGHM